MYKVKIKYSTKINNFLYWLSEQLRLRFEHRNYDIKRPVLLEKKLDSGWQGWTSNYIEVVIPDPEGVFKRGQVVEWELRS